jgi:hypothetical protein
LIREKLDLKQLLICAFEFGRMSHPKINSMQLVKSRRIVIKYIRAFSVVLMLFLFSSCGPKISPPPAFASCTFNINGIFSSCHNPLNNPYPLTYSGTLTTEYYASGDAYTIDTKTFSNTVENGTANQTIVARIPAAGTEATWQVVVTIDATQCSTCALTGGNDGCIQSQPGNYYLAGYPTISFSSILSNQYTQTVNFYINNGHWGENVPGHCQCEVPTN